MLAVNVHKLHVYGCEHGTISVGHETAHCASDGAM